MLNTKNIARKSSEQWEREHKDSLSEVPQRGTHEGGGLGIGGSSEGEMPNLRNGISAQKDEKEQVVREKGMPGSEGQIVGRVAVGIKNRVDRLKAIGNGQVPLCAAYAFSKLSQGVIE